MPLFLLTAITAAVFFFLREPVKQALAPKASISATASVSPSSSPALSPGVSFEVINTPHKPAKYIFIMIGDGMGKAQRDLAQGYAEYRGEETSLIMNSLPVSGSVKTNSLNAKITDSAAAATAYATGHKTNNGMLSVSPEGEKLKTIMEEAEEKGLSTGLVTTTSITNATPAAFAAHAESRASEADIALDYLDSGVDFFAGGGASYFLPAAYSGGMDAAGKQLVSLRKDENDLVSDFEEAGYMTFIGADGAAAFENYIPAEGDKVFASFTNSHMPYELDRRTERLGAPGLAEMTDKAISALEYDEDGFVLMVEGGRIDHACHANDPAGAISEALAFNGAVEEAYAFYTEHPGETLIIVLADHETGGLKSEGDLDFSHIAGVRLSVTERLKPFYTGDRKAFYDYLSLNFGLDDLNPSERARIESAFDFADSKKYKGDYKGSPASIVSAILSKRTEITWAGTGHSDTPVPLYAIGLRAEDFSGNIDNTAVGLLLFDIIGN